MLAVSSHWTANKEAVEVKSTLSLSIPEGYDMRAASLASADLRVANIAEADLSVRIKEE